MIPEDGFNGIAATTWEEEFQKKIKGFLPELRNER